MAIKTEHVELSDRQVDTEKSFSVGRLARILNEFRDRNKFEGISYGFFYLTNECNYTCDMCYLNSRPGLKKTRLNPELSLEIMAELQGIDEIILSGGEVSLLPYFEEQLNAASKAAGFVTVYTNGSGFLNRGELKLAGDDNEKIVASVRNSLEEKLTPLPPNVEITLPVTEYHLVYDRDHMTHKYHEAIVTTGSELAKEWTDRIDRPKIRFIAKNTPGKPNSGNELIQQFGILDLGSTGASFPGGIYADGRALEIKEARKPLEVNMEIEGGIHINYQGVFANEPSLMRKLHFGETTKGQICHIDFQTTTDSVIQAVTDHVSKYPQGIV